MRSTPTPSNSFARRRIPRRTCAWSSAMPSAVSLAEHSAPAPHRLETAFDGGKTHTLIALTHLGFRGRELASVTQGIIDTHLLHAPGEMTVVGITGDEIPVHKPQGSHLVPIPT